MRQVNYRNRQNVRLLAAIGVGLCASEFCRGVEVSWNIGSGDFNVAANWAGGVLPGAADQAIINNNGSATISASPANLAELWVGKDNGPGRLIMTAGNLVLPFVAGTPGAGGSGTIMIGRVLGSAIGGHSNSILELQGGSIDAGQIEMGQSFVGLGATTGAQLILSGSASLTIHNTMRVGHGDFNSSGGAGSVIVKDNAIFTHDGTGTLPFIDDFIAFGFNGFGGGNVGSLTVQDNGIFRSRRPVRFGWVEEGQGFGSVSGNAQLLIDSGEGSPAAFMLGDFNNSATGRCAGTFNQSGGTVSIGTSAARPQWSAIGGSGVGIYNMSGGTLNAWINGGFNVADTDQNGNAGQGTFNITGGTVNVTELWAGKIGRAQGVINQSAGLVVVGLGDFVDLVAGGGLPATGPDDSRLALGGFELAGGLTAESTGSYNLSGGTLRAAGINIGSLARGFFNQSAGTAVAEQGVIIARGTNNLAVAASGELNLNGGTFQTLNIVGGDGTSVVNFNGGTLKAFANQANFLNNLTTANVAAGGAKFDSSGFTVSSGQPLTGVGGLTKLGAGTLRLTGANSYAGTTTVQAGRLELGVLAQAPVFTGAGADIQGGRLVLDYVGPATPAAVLAALDLGFDQTPKFSSGPLRTSNPPNPNRGLGWVDDTTNSQVIVGYTYYGDVNLDGQVDVGDLGILASNWQGNGPWSRGDFNYDGLINVADLGELATNWQQGVGNPLGPSLSEALAALGLPAGAVPEPCSIALMLLGTLGWTSLRPRSRRAMP